MKFDRQFIIENLMNKSGRLNPRALEKFNITVEQAYQIYNEIYKSPKCKTCDNITKLISFNKGYHTFCSVSCASKNKETVEKRHQTVMKNYSGYGSREITEKKKTTSQLKYGVEWARQSKEYLAQLKTTWNDTYGVTNFNHTPAAVNKRKQTNLKKYGVANPAQNETIKKKIKNTNMSRYGVVSTLLLDENRQKSLSSRRIKNVYELLNNKEWLEKNKDVSSTTLSESLGVAWSTILNYFAIHGIARKKFTLSSAEKKIQDLLDSIGVEYETKDRQILNGKEIDILIPSYNLGIEIDGIYWHSSQFIDDPLYHQNKLILANQKSIQLLHITDEEINHKFDIVKERLYTKLGKNNRVFARKCRIVEIDNETYKQFMIKHHIQGYASASVRYGLTINSEIQAIMAFSKSRFNKKYEWELIRFASKNTVVGGAGKLFKHFLSTVMPTSVISYADLRWNTGLMYEKIGMNFSHTTRPNYWYVTDDGLKHRTSFQKHKLGIKLENYDSKKTEAENMKENGFYKFWDCGNNVYIWSAEK